MVKFDYQTGQTTTNQIPAYTVSYNDSIAGESSVYVPELIVDYSLEAEYGTNGFSPPASADIEDANIPQATAFTGSQGRLTLFIPDLPNDLSYLKVYRQQNLAYELGRAVYGPYAEDGTSFFITSPLADGYFEIPVSEISNGVCQLPYSQIPPFYEYQLGLQTVRSNGVASGWQPLGSDNFVAPPPFANTSFVDARQQLKDNLRFILRAAGENCPFAFSVNEGLDDWYLPPAFAWPLNNYVYSGFYGEGGEYFGGGNNLLQPIHANCFYRNFVFDQNNFETNGLVKTGCSGGGSYTLTVGGFPISLPCLDITNFPAYYFNVAGYLTNNAPIPSSQLASSQTQWILPARRRQFVAQWGHHADKELLWTDKYFG